VGFRGGKKKQLGRGRLKNKGKGDKRDLEFNDGPSVNPESVNLKVLLQLNELFTYQKWKR